MMKKIFTCLALLLMATSSVYAQANINSDDYDENGFLKVTEPINAISDEEDSDEFGPVSQQVINDPSSYKQGEIVSCFDYYTFGSVDINLTQDLSSYDPGDIIFLRGKIVNNNQYPLIDLDIKARLVKDIPAPVPMRAEVMILDEFDVAENITIGADGEYEVSYSHVLPLNAPSGEYQMYFYAVEQDRFNMSGLSFTNDVTGSRLGFDVSGDTPEHVYLDQTNIIVGGQNHNTMGFMTQHQKDAEIPVTIPVYNPTSETKNMLITYSLYSWDAANTNNLISTATEEITVDPKSEKIVTYTIKGSNEPAYYLSISAEPKDQSTDASVHNEKTISNIRLIVQDIHKTRINFVTTDTYPLMRGQDATLVTCFHDTSNGMNEDVTKIETILRDTKGKEVARSVYEGTVSSQISAIAQKINPMRDMVNYSIETTSYNSNGDVIDRFEKLYNCQDINPDLCPNNSSKFVIISLFIGLLLILALGAVLAAMKRKSTNIEII